MKKTGKPAEEHYSYIVPDTGELIHKTPEFARMSLRPGLGAAWFDKYGLSDIYESGGTIVLPGPIHFAPPRYYDVLCERKYPELFEKVKEQRIAAQKGNLAESLDQRRETKDEVQRLNFERLLKRSLK